MALLLQSLVVCLLGSLALAQLPPSTNASMVTSPCDPAVVKATTARITQDPSSPLVPCAQSLDMLPKQYLALNPPTKTQCRLLVNNTACVTYYAALVAALDTIQPACMLADGSTSNTPLPYDAMVTSWCTLPPRKNTTTNSTTVQVPTAINVNTPPPPRTPPLSQAAAVVLSNAAILVVGMTTVLLAES
ncbi:Aste57867_22679 [Aphanomyces stellatus]|uniref:Aste57867_22679 protein n=1 Tax=Aphanomyces stellatus TaxID=120398 RepID=A0A485LQI0_9STRA|nr:hypothetical protein As57867_022609 [Aphanomyces stellatus]VFT99333.1 Aste57867_22679 [Aphanomyces stellatus]